MTAITVRPPRREETDALTALVLRSKAHWGYDAAFLDACRESLTVTAAHLARSGVAERGGVLAGIYTLMPTDDPDTEDVELFFVDPPAIGTGVGRALWNAMVADAAARGVRRLSVVSDPHARPFYERMGASYAQDVPSECVPGRTLPLLYYSLNPRQRPST